MKLSQEYFDNKREQCQIKEAVYKALPKDLYYHNLIIAFSEMLQRFIVLAFHEEVHGKLKDEGDKTDD
jgi:hypothetical protein